MASQHGAGDRLIVDDLDKKYFTTKDIETSICILDSPENNIVQEALVFLSKYANINTFNLNHLLQRGLLRKLITLSERDKTILRLELRLLNLVLNVEGAIDKFIDGSFDDKIKRILHFYINVDDYYIKEFSLKILVKLAVSARIQDLFISEMLLNPLLETIRRKEHPNLKTIINLFGELLNAPAAEAVLPKFETPDIIILIEYLIDPDNEISKLVQNVIFKLVSLNLDRYQKTFRDYKLVETMLEQVVNPKMENYRDIALNIILKCMESEVTDSYFTESIEFLKFCEWVKTCNPTYHLKSIQILCKLSSMPRIRQMLFDFSVEESILAFLTSSDKAVLNKACIAIDNMSEHIYCCEQMLTNTNVIRAISDMLGRDDTEDPENAVAIKTLTNLTLRSLKTMDLLDSLSVQFIFIEMFKKGMTVFSEESFLNIIKVLYQFACHPVYQVSVVGDKFFVELLKILKTGTDHVAILCLEILTYLIPNQNFMPSFLSSNGPYLILEKLKNSNNQKLISDLLMFIYSSLFIDAIMMQFIQQDVVTILKNFSDSVKHRIPFISTLLSSVLDTYLPLKFFELNRLEFTDKLKDKFYLVSGKNLSTFPLLEMCHKEEVSSLKTIYVVDYSFGVISSRKKRSYKKSSTSSSISEDFMSGTKRSYPNSSASSSNVSVIVTENPSSVIRLTIPSPCNVKLGFDPFLPTYIYHINQYFEDESDVIIRIKILAEYVNTILSLTEDSFDIPQKLHAYRVHVHTLKTKLGSNLIPIGYLRQGLHCERALLFKAIGDKTCIPSCLVHGENNLFWNEIGLIIGTHEGHQAVKLYIVDLMFDIGNLMEQGSEKANKYCHLTKFICKSCS